MNKREIIERLKNIAEHAVHTVGEEPFVMSLDDGIAVHEAIKLLEKPKTDCSGIPNNSDTISRAEAQTAIQFAARRYTVAHEAHGEGQVVWSDNLINVTDAMNVLRNLPSVQPDITTHGHILTDYISRQAALNLFLDDNLYWDTNGGYSPHYAKTLLKNLPSVQPERKVGKWIRGKSWSEGAGMGESYGYYWKCNQCNNIVKGDWSQCGDNFCSECGADMRGGKNG